MQVRPTRLGVASRSYEVPGVLEHQQLFVLICVVTVATSAVIVADEARRRALDARVLSALWFLEPGGSVSLLRFLFGDSVATEDVCHALRRLERAAFVTPAFGSTEATFTVTPAGCYRLERGGLGLRALYESMPAT